MVSGSQYNLSILILSLVSRTKFLTSLLAELDSQIKKAGRQDVQILVLTDNKSQTIGEKRNHLLNLAEGKYLTYLDDDDRVSSDYISEIMEKLTTPLVDCVVFDCIAVLNAHKATGGRQFYCKYGVEFEQTKLEPWSESNCFKRENTELWFGKPAHTMVWRSELVKHIQFKHINAGEDFAWINLAWPLIKKQVRIDKVLYYYDVVLGKDY